MEHLAGKRAGVVHAAEKHTRLTLHGAQRAVGLRAPAWHRAARSGSGRCRAKGWCARLRGVSGRSGRVPLPWLQYQKAQHGSVAPRRPARRVSGYTVCRPVQTSGNPGAKRQSCWRSAPSSSVCRDLSKNLAPAGFLTVPPLRSAKKAMVSTTSTTDPITSGSSSIAPRSWQ